MGDGTIPLDIIINRLENTDKNIRKIILTTENKSDDKIVEKCIDNNWLYFRGDENDLLDRHYKAACFYESKIVGKIPSDCVYIDFNVVNSVINILSKGDYDYVSNLHPESFPYGNDVEIFRVDTLYKAWKNAKLAYQREHTTPYITENPNLFKIGNCEMVGNYSKSHRVVLDYPEDFCVIQYIYHNLYRKNPLFKVKELISFMDKHSFLKEMTAKYQNSQWYNNLKHE